MVILPLAMQIQIHQENFQLDALSALFWPKYQALFIADVHLGKTEHFRKNGAAIPQGIGSQNYKRLDLLLQKYQPQQVYFLVIFFILRKIKIGRNLKIG